MSFADDGLTLKLSTVAGLVGSVKHRVGRRLDECFCDDGRGLPECEKCTILREVYGELELVQDIVWDEVRSHNEGFFAKVKRKVFGE